MGLYAHKDKAKIVPEKMLNYISASSMQAYYSSPNKFWATRLIIDRLPYEPQGLAAAVGTAFDIKVKEAILANGTQLCVLSSVEKIKESLEKGEFHDKALEEGRKILLEYKRAGILQPKLRQTGPLIREFVQIEGEHAFNVGIVPLFAKLDAVVIDPFTCKKVPFDWKVMGGGATAGVSPKKGYAGVCSTGQWGASHKLYVDWEAKSNSSGYDGVNIPMEEIDDKFATQFCIYGWALQAGNLGTLEPKDFVPFPVHFDSAVYNGKNREIKIYQYRAIVSVEYQHHVYEKLSFMWRDLKECGAKHLRERLESQVDISLVKSKAEKESWW